VNPTRLSFLGAAGTVTGSRHLLETRDRRILVDCGLFQGPKRLREKNWEPFPVEPASLDAIVLTHAHIDHIGFLPAVVKHGFRGPIHCTAATADLAGILLPDTGHLQEEEARWRNKKGRTKHRPAKPLFDERDARAVLPLLRPVPYGTHFEVAPGLRGKYRDMGHILGSASVDIKTTHPGRSRKIVFTGDIGRPRDSLLRAPEQVYNIDYLVMESTYGDRLHAEADPVTEIARVINETMERDGVLVIPAFAVGRSQTLLYVLRQLEDSGRIPPGIPVFLDSPMAVEALQIHRRHIADLNLTCRRESLAGEQIFRPRNLNLSVTRDDSKRINAVKGRAIIISASGMATGGRIVHHLAERLPFARHTVLFIGYQAEGTRGRTILEGRPSVRLFGHDTEIKARIERIEGFSGHADYQEMMAWLLGLNRPPERIFLVHGEPANAEAFATRLRDHFKWDVTAAEEGQSVILDL
jgi:metallo-beta-lactamase family protein